jgi:hypothetical protein
MSVRSVSRRAPVVVVGAGVSGCACAAVLAAAGQRVTLINSALDVVGMPGYGPVISCEEGRDSLTTSFGRLPPAYWEAWLEDAWEPASLPGIFLREEPGPQTAELTSELESEPEVTAGAPARQRQHPPFVLIDRRAVSIRVKWLLEGYLHLDLRQALVTGLDPVTSVEWKTGARVKVQTDFGESLPGSACVLAVGLSLGGSVRVGRQSLPGGRYGEPAADRLHTKLLELRVPFVQSSRMVGSRLTLVSRGSDQGIATDADPTAPEGAESPGAVERRPSSGWQRVSLHPFGGPHPSPARSPASAPEPPPACIPPARTAVPSPYHDLLPEMGWAWLARPTAEAGLRGIFPDGRAARLWYASPGLGGKAGSLGYSEAQGEQSICGSVWSGGGTEKEYRQRVLPHVWACGQVTGAADYLGSLASGAEAAHQILRSMNETA